MAEKPASAEKKRGTAWLIAAIIAAQIAQMLLKQAHHEHSPAMWAMGCIPLVVMAFCMMRSWQYLYLGRTVSQTKAAEKQFEKK